jgi:hypothetical protein
VVAHAVVDGLGVGDVAQAPVGVEGRGGELLEAGLGMVEDRACCRRVPPGERGIDGAGAVEGAVEIAAEGVAGFLRIVILGVDGFGDGFGTLLRGSGFSESFRRSSIVAIAEEAC